MAKIYPVIMSGGPGSRLWPLSRLKRPKQYHALATEGTASDRTMFDDTVLRLVEHGGADIAAPIIICARDHLPHIDAHYARYGTQLLAKIIEPIGRNTAAVAAVAASYVGNIDPDGVIALLPADHHIEDAAKFWTAIQQGALSAEQGFLTTLGISPTSPQTGFGYIKRGESLSQNTYRIAAFKEKPDMQTAQTYLEAGDYFWNAGIFLFQAKTLQKEFESLAPDIYEKSLSALTNAEINTTTNGDDIYLNTEAFTSCRAESIDYAIMEKTNAAALIAPVDIGWDDLGTWSSIHKLLSKNNDSVKIGDAILVDTKNTFVRSDGPVVATLGVEDLVIVATGDAVLVMKATASQDVKKLIEELKKQGHEKLL